ncbi:MAG: small subunit ribosomal protein, partial [Candidatus Eremiobacteraeota bacterium]|nr:small subunit ribosomal protein [Candidatus Eremiobacteraeota bacterium]
MNESDATEPTSAPTAQHTAPPAEVTGPAVDTAPDQAVPPELAPAADGAAAASADAGADGTNAGVDGTNSAGDGNADAVAPAGDGDAMPAAEPAEDEGEAVEINPAAEPPPDEEPSAAVAAAPPAVSTGDAAADSTGEDAALAEDAVAAVEINPAAEPPADEQPYQAAEESVPVSAPAASADIAAVENPPDASVADAAVGDEVIAAVEINPAAEPEATAEPAAGAEPASAPAAGESVEAAPAAAKPGPKPPDPRAEERRQRAQQAWERVVAARESGEILSGTVTAAVKGGLLVDVAGIRGFLPASQVRVPLGTAIDTLVKTKVPLKVIDIDQTRRRIVVSHRRAAEEERRHKRTELLRSLEVGQMREGVVVRLAEFGAFVDLGGVDGLIPMRELAFERIDKAGDVVTIGEHLQVEVLRIDENGKKISLSRKNALPDPWRDHANVLRQGSTVEGRVVAKEPRLQVELAPGVVGSIRESDADPADYELGEAIEVLVRRVDRATRRITLTTMHGAAAVPP